MGAGRHRHEQRRQHRDLPRRAGAGRLRAGAHPQDHLHAPSSRSLRHLEGLQGAHRRDALPAPRPSTSARRASCPAIGRPRRCASSSPTACRCSASPTCRGRATSGAGSTSPRAPDVPLDDGDVIEIGRPARSRSSGRPATRPATACSTFPPSSAMIVGDHLLPKITPHVGFAPGSTGNPLGDFLASQRKVQRFDVDLVLPAHGGVVSRPPPPRQSDHPAPPGAAAGHPRHRPPPRRTTPTTSPAAPSPSTATARSPTSSRRPSRRSPTSNTCATTAPW